MKYKDTQIAEAVASSSSWADVYRKVTGAPVEKSSPGFQAHFKRRAVKAGINFDHFKFKRKAKALAPVVEIAAVTPAVA